MRGLVRPSNFLCGLLLLACDASCPAQTPALLLDRLHQTAENTTLDASGAPPFHLRLAVEVFPQYGRLADKGTVEVWWNGPKESRTVYDLSQYHGTVVQTPEGLHRSVDLPDSPYIVDYMLSQIMHPVPQDISEADFKLTSTRLSIGKTSLDCILTAPARAKPTDVTGNRYCFDDQGKLRVLLTNPDQYNLRQQLGSLGKLQVPLTLQYSFVRKEVAVATIQTLQTQRKPYPEATDVTGLPPVESPSIALPGQTLSGHLLHKPDPSYPVEAKEKRISGTVLLHGIIGVDGKVKKLSLVGSPDDSLTRSSMEAVGKWIYAPNLLNGVPTEVDTTITVNYTFAVH